MLTVLTACDYMQKDPVTGDYSIRYAENTFFTKIIESEVDIKPSSMVSKFTLDRYIKPKSMKELHQELKVLEKDPHACVIRYEFFKAEVGDVVVRRASELRQVKSNIVAIDVDDVPLPPNMDKTDLVSQGKYVLSLLVKADNEFFTEDTGFIAQASSSAGFSNKIKLHMWFWNKSPVNQQQIKNAMYRLKTKGLVDLALYSTGQIHYTAAPIIRNIADPFKLTPRTVLVEGCPLFIPATYPEYVSPAKTTPTERFEYLDSVVGSIKPSSVVEKLLDTIKGWNPKTRGLRTKVIALYHNAIQTQYNIELLDKEVLECLAVLRPKQGQKYINEAKTAAMNHIKACSGRDVEDKVLGLPINSLSGGKHERFLDVNAFPKNHATFLKASLGTGKTATIERMLSTGKIRGTFLAITDTSALVEANAKRFNAGDFRNRDHIDAFNSKHLDRLSGTLHSLAKLEAVHRRFDFVFIDEADSVLNTLLFASIIKDHTRQQIIERLSSILRTCERVVFSDGDLSQETIQCYVDLMEGVKPISSIIHYRKNLNNVPAFRHKSPNSLWGAVEACLSVGQKCLVVTDNSPDTLNIYAKVLSRVFPYKKIEVAHAASKMDEIVVRIINETTEALKELEIDALLCSPSITNGVDFNYFDTVFVITSTDIHSPNMRFQALMRERQPKEIHYYLSPTVKGFDTGYSGLGESTDWLTASRKLIAVRKEREYKVYGATFNYYLIKAGCKIQYVDDPYLCPKTKVDEEEYLDEKALAVIESALLGKVVPRHNNAFQLYDLIRAMWNIEQPTFDEVRFFLKEEPHVKMEFFHKIADEFWDIIKYNNPYLLQEELKSERGHRFYLLTGMSLKKNSGADILKACGMHDDIEDFVKMYKRFCLELNYPISPAVHKTLEVIDELGAS